MFGGLFAFFEKHNLNIGIPLLVVGVLMFALSLSWLNLPLTGVLRFAAASSPIWLPIFLFLTFFHVWMRYIQKAYDLNQGGRVTLEILIPQEIFKSPMAMELVLNEMWSKASPDNLMETYIDGKNPPTYGLEIVSHGGTVHFYINTPRKKFKNVVETQLYAQYPGIEVRELPVDYTAEIVWDDDEFETFTLHFGLKRPDIYPIKTYFDFGLADNPKEEEKIDPITSTLDLLGSIGPNERVWMQLLIRAHRDEDFEVGSLISHPDWKDDIRAEIDQIMKRDENKVGAVEYEGMPRITEGEKRVVQALERSLSKYAFNTGIKVFYAAKKGHSQIGERLGPMIALFYQYTDQMLNEIGMKWRTDFNYNIYADPTGKRRREYKRKELDYYKRRVYWIHEPNDRKSIMTTEEIATLFHLPGQVATTPTLGRIPSTRAEAPPNLPTGA